MSEDLNARLVDLDEVYEMAYKISHQVTESSYNFDMVIGIARGGFPPARLVCDFLNIEALTAVQVSHYAGGGKEKEELRISDPVDIDLEGRNVLIVDDVNDSGKTLKTAVKHVKNLKPAEIKTAVLHEKRNTSIKADFVGGYLTDWKWLIYQWAAAEDLIEFLKEDDMLTAGKEEMRQHLSDKYKLDVSSELLDKVLSMQRNYLQ